MVVGEPQQVPDRVINKCQFLGPVLADLRGGDLGEGLHVNLVGALFADAERPADALETDTAASQGDDTGPIGSNHDFAGTPARDEIVARLLAMQRLGADICKIATMPHSPADVLTLLDATRIMAEGHADRPLITMAMGALAIVSRVSGETFGSAATFGMAGHPVRPPGQIPVEDLHAVLTVLRRAHSG